jgi:hypothetical protein
MHPEDRVYGDRSTAVLVVNVKPGSSRTRVLRASEEEITLAVKEPPRQGRANRELIRFLSRRLCLDESDLRIVGGAGGRRKKVLVKGMTKTEIVRRLGG